MKAIYKSRDGIEYAVRIIQFGMDGYAVIMHENGKFNYVPVTNLTHQNFISKEDNQ